MYILKKSKHFLIGAFIVALTGCCTHYNIDTIDYKSPQKPALILIGDPQAYSRASLINDRRLETEYLKELLDKSKSVTFTPEIVRDLITRKELSAGLGLNLGMQLSTTNLTQQIEATQLQMQLAVLQKQMEGIENASAPNVTIPAPDLSNSNNSPIFNATTMWPDVSSIQNTISDIEGNLKNITANQSVTAPNNASTYAALMDPREDFIDRQAYRGDIRAALAEAQLDDIHDRGGNALYRLQFTATVCPPDDSTKQWGATKMEIKAPKFKRSDLQSYYRNWLLYISSQLTSGLPNINDNQLTNVHNYNYDRYISLLAEKGFFNVVDIFRKKTAFYCANHSTASDQKLRDIIVNGGENGFQIIGTYAVPINFSNSNCVNYNNAGSTNLKDGLLTAAQRDQLPAWMSINKPKSPSLTFMNLTFNPGKSAPISISIPPIFRETVLDGNCIPGDIDASACTAAGGSSGETDYAIRSYSVMPTELMQRLGMTSEASQSFQTAISIAAQISASAAADGNLGYLSQSDERSQALARQPLVVGFAGSDPETQKDGDSFFGWLFGPQFIADNPKTLDLKQTLRHYQVESDVSIPGWWEYITLNISSAWIGNWNNAELMDPKKAATVSKPVNFPLTDAIYESLTNFIAAQTIGEQNSRIFAQYVVPNIVPACASKVSFQIGGANVWRADSIFLGGARAQDINILPDMSGVVADFNMADVFGSLVNTDNSVQKIPLMISSEQGSADSLDVYVIGKRISSNGATYCQSPVAFPTNLSLLPPTVSSYSPSDICQGAVSVPLIIQGLNLPFKKCSVQSQFFKEKKLAITNDGTQMILDLDWNSKNNNISLPQTVPVVLVCNDKSFAVNINVKDCKKTAENLKQKKGGIKKN